SGQIDKPMATLISDLKERGLLDSTLVIWMGEFGRTPRINARGAKPGRDHYPRAWSTVLFGGGIKAGQVIGKTDKEGASVVERPARTGAGRPVRPRASIALGRRSDYASGLWPRGIEPRSLLGEASAARFQCSAFHLDRRSAVAMPGPPVKKPSLFRGGLIGYL